MTDERPPVVFIADSLALDFLNTNSTPAGVQTDWILSGEDLLGWFRQADLISADDAQSLRANAGLGELDAVAAQACMLREWFRDFVVKHKGRPLHINAARQLEPLNRVLVRDAQFGQIGARRRAKGDSGVSTSPFIWSMQRRWQSPGAMLFPIARSMADLICNDDFTHVKACEGPACALHFVDRTHGHGRRWCEMTLCGNRAKQAALRERIRTARASSQ